MRRRPSVGRPGARQRPVAFAPTEWDNGNDEARGGTVTRDEVIATLRAHEEELKRAGIRHVALFGSTARGAEHPRDVDLLIAFDDAKRYTLLDQSRVQQ